MPGLRCADVAALAAPAPLGQDGIPGDWLIRQPPSRAPACRCTGGAAVATLGAVLPLGAPHGGRGADGSGAAAYAAFLGVRPGCELESHAQPLEASAWGLAPAATSRGPLSSRQRWDACFGQLEDEKKLLELKAAGGDEEHGVLKTLHRHKFLVMCGLGIPVVLGLFCSVGSSVRGALSGSSAPGTAGSSTDPPAAAPQQDDWGFSSMFGGGGEDEAAAAPACGGDGEGSEAKDSAQEEEDEEGQCGQQ
mmetsp:Transcript_62892/g.187499  ORF Transcript_62892/g.187499 Transcript_62892/m.187499 type:complete len:249 (+) Transcript_62892:37-783(+)